MHKNSKQNKKLHFLHFICKKQTCENVLPSISSIWDVYINVIRQMQGCTTFKWKFGLSCRDVKTVIEYFFFETFLQKLKTNMQNIFICMKNVYTVK